MTGFESHAFLTRRAVLGSTAVGLGTALIPDFSSAELPDIKSLPLDYFDPFAAPDSYIQKRFLYFHTPSTARTFARLWSTYEKTGNPTYGEWALIYLFPWWRSSKTRKDRIRITTIAERASAKYISNHTNAPGGLMWQAIMKSAKVATLGLLEAAHILQEILDILENAEQKEREYYKPIIGLSRAKIYYKAPAFPASVGNMRKSEQMIEAFKKSSGTVGAWWTIAAEFEYITGNKEKALDMLRDVEHHVHPPDMLLAYSLDTVVFDAFEFLKAIKTNRYSRYMWDPFFLTTKPGLNKNWKPT